MGGPPNPDQSQSPQHEDYLMLGIDQSLAVVPLDDAMRGLHLGRVVVREVTADLLAGGPVAILKIKGRLQRLQHPLEQ